jgi:4-hydroxybenzoate polyprenyltransferase
MVDTRAQSHVSTATTQPPTAPAGTSGPSALAEAMRMPHWIKNAFVAAPLLFSRSYDQPLAWLYTLAAFAALSLLSSAGYLINDIRDRHADRLHPAKRCRPVASGRLSVATAALAAAVLMALGLAIAAALSGGLAGGLLPPAHQGHQAMGGYGLLAWAGAYLAMSLCYSFWLKRLVIVDVLVVAMGFVLRAMAGAAAISVAVSPWLVVCTLSLCVYIALAKRRSELADLPADQAQAVRAANRSYDARDVEHMLTVSAAMAVLTYSLYCLAPSTIQHFGSAHMVWTIPLVVYGMFRYNRITRLAGAGEPVGVLLRDKPMWLVLAAYVALTALVQKVGSCPQLAGVLEFPR